MSNHHNAYLIANNKRTSNYTVYDGNIEYIYEEINPPIIGKQYHEDEICWDLSQLTYDVDIPEYYYCTFVQIDDHNFRLVSFTK